MDIQHLIDRLEELFNNSKQIPLTHSIAMDEELFLDIIDQMRVSVPDEVKKAQQIMAQKDRILAQAQESASRTLAVARDDADKLTSRDVISEAARVKAEKIIAEARKEAEQAKRDADEYVVEALTHLEMEIEKSLTQVRNGIRSIQAEHRPPPPRIE
jgi:L-rhamnose isomerase